MLVEHRLQGVNNAPLFLHIAACWLDLARVVHPQIRLQKALEHALAELIFQEDQVDLVALCSLCQAL